MTGQSDTPKSYSRPGTHRIIINTVNRISGDKNDGWYNIKMSSTMSSYNLTHIQLECATPISSATALNIGVAIPSVSQPYSYDTRTELENTIVGFITTKFFDGTNHILTATAQDNNPVYCSSLDTIIKSGRIQIQFIDDDGFPTTLADDITISLIVS